MLFEKIRKLFLRRKVKYFCIGRNKTGTTSIMKLFQSLDIDVGNQREAEILTDNFYFRTEYKEIIDYCYTADAFQDVPFSYPETFKVLDKEFPHAKFILTVRDPEEWYQSLTTFHGKMFGKNGLVPTYDDLKKATYVREGYMLRILELYGTNEEDPYHKETLIRHYLEYNNSVLEYFEGRKSKLLVIDLSDGDAKHKLSSFLGLKDHSVTIPWENKTSEIKND